MNAGGRKFKSFSENRRQGGHPHEQPTYGLDGLSSSGARTLTWTYSAELYSWIEWGIYICIAAALESPLFITFSALSQDCDKGQPFGRSRLNSSPDYFCRTRLLRNAPVPQAVIINPATTKARESSGIIR
jgi:hypothetical protein